MAFQRIRHQVTRQITQTLGQISTEKAAILAISAAVIWLGFFTLWSALPGGLQLDWDYFNSLSLLVRSSVLHYHRLPIHDPWTFGGLDILANPQNRLLSPFFLFDLAFSPPLANTLSLTLLGFMGAWGAYRWMRELGCARDGAWVGALLFVNSSWFGLHFAEGHIPFGGIQLLPWALFFARKLDNPRRFFGLVALYVFWILDGAMYAVGLSLIALLGAWLVGDFRFRAPPRSTLPAYILMICAGLLLAAARLIPLLTFYSHHSSDHYYATLTPRAVWEAFFSPRQSPLRPVAFETALRFHEYGCYIGIVGFLCGLTPLFTQTKKTLKHYLWVLFLLWVGCNWFAATNPWHLFEFLPVVGSLRVQSRVFVVLHLFWSSLIARAFSAKLRGSSLAFLTAGFLIIEATYVKSLPLQEVAKNYPRSWPQTLMTHSDWKGTKAESAKPEHYLNGEWGSKHSYEPVHPMTPVYTKGDPEYRGEIFYREGSGSASILRVEPGFIEFAATPAPGTSGKLTLNLAALDGWTSSTPGPTVSRDEGGRILIDLNGASGIFSLKYRPEYLWTSVCAYFFGLITALWVARGLLFAKSSAKYYRPPDSHEPSPADT